MRTHFIIALTLIMPLMSLTGCDTVQRILEQTPKPGARLTAMDIESIALTEAILDLEVEITNPYDIDLPLVDLAYGLQSGGLSIARGDVELQGSVPANGSRRINLPLQIMLPDLVERLGDVRPGAVIDYNASLDLAVDAPAIGRQVLPVSRSGQLPIPNVPEVSVSDVAWGRLGLDVAEAVVAIELTNTNDFPIDLSMLDYALSLAGTDVANTSIRPAGSITPGRTRTLEIPISVRPIDLGLAFYNMIRGEDAAYDFSGVLEAGTPFGPISLPLDASGRTPFSGG